MMHVVRLICAVVLVVLGGFASANAGGIVTRDAKRTIILAERGNPRAQGILGFMYAHGRDVPQSYDLAVFWYTRAAERGDAFAQYQLGLMYDKGFGVTQDVILAHTWLNLSAAHAPRRTREDVIRMRDAVATKMTRAQLELAQRLAVGLPLAPRW